MFEPEVVDAVCCGLVGAVEDDQVVVVVVLDVADGEVEPSWTYRCGESSRDGPADACGGCNMNLPPQVINEIMMKKNLIFCESCARILYIEE